MHGKRTTRTKGASRHDLILSLKKSLRTLRLQLSILNHRIGARVNLKLVELDCLDLIALYGPIAPSALVRLSGLHPATLTGILDRLESGEWIVRERDPVDRRAIILRVLPTKSAEMQRQFAGMNALMDSLCSA